MPIHKELQISLFCLKSKKKKKKRHLPHKAVFKSLWDKVSLPGLELLVSNVVECTKLLIWTALHYDYGSFKTTPDLNLLERKKVWLVTYPLQSPYFTFHLPKFN